MSLFVDIEKKCGSFLLKVKFETADEVFGVLGASGCGKSLTLKCIAGIEKPDKGVIKLDGRVLFDSQKRINIPVRKRKIGYLFQDYALFTNMTVMQNIMCGARDKKKAHEFVKNFYLEEKKELYPDRLSGGQKQRVALARMLASEPELILLDEPFSALDNYLKTNLERQVMDMFSDYNKSVLFVSHDRNEIYRMTDRIAVMEDGRIVDIQAKKSLFDTPKSLAATLLSGCKNVTTLSAGKDGMLYAKDWGIQLNVPEAFDGDEKKVYKYAAFRAHYFERVQNMEDENVLECDIVRVIEDTFSIVVLFTNKGCVKSGDFSVLTWELQKDEWEKIKNERIFLKIPSEKIMLLEK